MIPGFTTKITSKGILVRRFHYSADTHKRPGVPAGDQWIAEEALAYPLGMDDPRWHKEMEIKYSAMGGMFLFPLWERWKRTSNIIINPYDPVGYNLFGAYDHGYATPSSFHVHGINGDGLITAGLWEFYADHVPAHQIADIIHGRDITTQDGRDFKGCPFHDQLSWIVSDPRIFAEDLPQHNGPNKSTAAIYRECGISMLEGQRGGDITVAEWLTGYYWEDPLNPKLRIACPQEFLETPPTSKQYSGPGAPMLTWELGQQRHKTFSSQVALSRNQPEDLVDKDNHAWDDFKYFIKRFPPPFEKRGAKAPANSFEWWRNLSGVHRSGTFQTGKIRDGATPKKTYRI